MTVRFKGADLQAVLANHCHLVLAKDQGAYFLSETGERRPDGRRK
jgi:hypothetical protein